MKKICLKSANKKILLIIAILLILNISLIYTKGNTINLSQREKHLISLYNDKKLLVLTFDDGPSKYTPLLLDLLKEKNVKVTFFVLGEKVEKYPEYLKREYDEKHLVCIHSYTHKFFTKISKEDIIEQISLTKENIYNETSYTPKFIRVPYGITNEKVDSILKEQKLINVLWSVDSLDWKYKEKNKTTNKIISTTTGNDIILMHDILQSSVDAAEQIIDYYSSKGYEFVTIEEFYHIKDLVNDEK